MFLSITNWTLNFVFQEANDRVHYEESTVQRKSMG